MCPDISDCALMSDEPALDFALRCTAAAVRATLKKRGGMPPNSAAAESEAA